MSGYESARRMLSSREAEERLSLLYGTREGEVVRQKARYLSVLEQHEKTFHADGGIALISAPGRTEIGGNHTDHNHGLVLAASVNLDTLAAVSVRSDPLVHLCSEGYAPITVDLADPEKHSEEEGTTAALIRGVASRFAAMGLKIGGFDATVTSTVASGSGLSSSAAFEVLIAAILDRLHSRANLDFVTQAKIGQYAENVYFGKPSGLLDQMASAAGGLVTVDFGSDEPKVKALSYDFAARGYALAVVATGGSHADLTDDYAAIPAEMKAVAAHFGKGFLREVPQDDFMRAIPSLRGELSDRAILRAMHFYAENERVTRQVEALERDDIGDFFANIIASGRSSFMYLQNVWAKPQDQSLSLALALAEELLSGRGAWRIHGGGFAGTTLNFVPEDLLERFVGTMDGAFGVGSCHVLNIRPVGAYAL
ncbi:MAG: galactokinase [Clostridia bacterium]|nr:galactokinase [Clostridia bacterium]